ncbi:unnamed protein product [Prunus armeniaca]|uniref:RNase H type-1 domain-containing protein n=1 Tax=Prunus armeniaca TaxID=36596 RepID=A0A6J5WBA6_PRUAR|nr:unnamed protein product [Prunus armeniaca]
MKIWCLRCGLEEDLCLFAVIGWMIWAERNKSLHGGVIRDHFAVYDASLVFYKDFVDLCLSPTLPRHVAICCWKPPEGDLLKLNVDGACCVADRKMGLGAVVRNANRELMGVMAKPLIRCLSPKAFEALAMIAGCQMEIDVGFTRIIIESDCLEVINAINRTEFDMSIEGELIEELKELLYHFVFVSV